MSTVVNLCSIQCSFLIIMSWWMYGNVFLRVERKTVIKVFRLHNYIYITDSFPLNLSGIWCSCKYIYYDVWCICIFIVYTVLVNVMISISASLEFHKIITQCLQLLTKTVIQWFKIYINLKHVRNMGSADIRINFSLVLIFEAI